MERKKRMDGRISHPGTGHTPKAHAAANAQAPVAVTTKINRNINIVDTNVPIYDPTAINELRRDGNLLVIPWTVLKELDKLKNNPEVKFEVREAIRLIDKLVETGDPSLIIERGMIFSGLELEKNVPDHQIIAGLNYVFFHFSKGHEPYAGYDKVKMITGDRMVKIFAREISKKNDRHQLGGKLAVEEYKKTKSKLNDDDLIIPRFNLDMSCIKEEAKMGMYFSIKDQQKEVKALKEIPEGGAIIGYGDRNPFLKSDRVDEWLERFVAIRRDDNFLLVNPGISASGIRPKSNGHSNWAQALALYYLLAYEVRCVFLQGGAGAGKTLLALAAGLELKRRGTYSQIIISRPTIPLDPDQQIGLLPGEVMEKVFPWLMPIIQNLSIIEGNKQPAIFTPEYVKDVLSRNNIQVQVLDYIRGSSLNNVFYIIDEAQNLTPHQVKTIITRVGESSKVVFTGDLGQIDLRKLDCHSSGLTYAMKKMRGSKLVGIANFKEVLRGELAAFAAEVL